LERRVVLEFHEDNETAIIAMRTGYSPVMRHISRTHGVDLRWLAAMFGRDDLKLYYERSALQAADIYTKGFTVPAEWDKALRLINVLDPSRFWHGRGDGAKGQMGSEHKGGVTFAYRTSNPWQSSSEQVVPDIASHTAAAPARVAPIAQQRSHKPWLDVRPPFGTSGAGGGGDPDPGELSDASTDIPTSYLDDYLQEADDCDLNDYASSDDDDDKHHQQAAAHGAAAGLSSSSALLGTSGARHAAAAVTATTCTAVASAACSSVVAAACSSSAAAAVVTSTADHVSPPRRVVEYCCGPNSRIGNLADKACQVIRLTVADDLTTAAGLDKALTAVSDPSIPTLLFGALPCTGGSTYVNLNWRLGPRTRTKIRKHWRTFAILWRNFVATAERCLANGGHVAIEWPRRCAYWRKRSVREFLTKHNLSSYHFDGCAYGLVSSQRRTCGRPIRKPWTIAATSAAFRLLCRTCPHSPSEHAKCEGADTRLTESYTDPLVHAIHQAWRIQCATVQEPTGQQMAADVEKTVQHTATHEQARAAAAGGNTASATQRRKSRRRQRDVARPTSA